MFDDKDKDMNNGNIENSENLEKEMQAANHFYDEFKNNEDRNEIHSEPEYTKHDNTVSEEPEKADFEQKSINDEGRHKSFHDENDSGVYRNRAPYEPIKDSYYRETVKKKRGGFKKIIAACLVVSLFGGTGIGAGYAAVNSFINSRQAAVYAPDSSGMSQNSKSSGGDISAPSGRSNNVLSLSATGDAVSVINSVYPSIVNITINVSGTTNYFGMSIPYQSEGAGSGVIFDEDDKYAYIVTNNHVVDEANSISISVTGVESIKAEIVGTDSTNDIAVIKVLKSDLDNAGVEYKVAKFGDSDKLSVGQSVIAIGNALGEGKSATGGMISVLNKSLELEGKHLTVIQTSAPINPGNSGGALVNYNGEVIGINTAKTNTTVAEGMGYAIPSNTVKEIMEKLETEGTQPKPYIGIMGSDITDELSQLYKLPVGVLVRQVFDGSPAQAGGLREGDIITAIGDKTVMDMDALINELSSLEIGQSVNLNVIRENKAVTITLKIADANNVGSAASNQ